MMKKADSKVRISELAADLQKSNAYEALAIRELVDLLFEEVKHSLVSSEGEATLRLQGEARALGKLYNQLTRPSPVKQEK
jgi:hypothetical protein